MEKLSNEIRKSYIEACKAHADTEGPRRSLEGLR